MIQTKEELTTDASSSLSSNRTSSKFPHEYLVRYLKGVGPRLSEILDEKGMHSAEDLFYFFPYKYLDQRTLISIKKLTPGKGRIISGKILSCGVVVMGRSRRKIFEILLGDGTGAVSLKWFRFNVRQMMGGFKKDMYLVVTGDATAFKGECQFIHPTIQVVDEEVVGSIEAPGIVPVYSQIQGLGQKVFRRMIRSCFDLFPNLQDPLPPDLVERLHLPSKFKSLHEIHYPPPEIELPLLENMRTSAFKREIFEEFFLMELGLALKRRSYHREEGTALAVSEEMEKTWYDELPFPLTGAQERVLSEIKNDLRQPHPMNRLLQGDVGCGKTVVSLMAAMMAISNGYQVALMAPTEILAEQHFLSAQKILKPFKIHIALLTSGVDEKEKKKIKRLTAQGVFSLVIGTHALLSDNVHFKALGLVIIDEQHRFGVMQRAALKEKGKNPHVLVMTATPIPRTLAMTIYGDLDLSVIDELPPGRTPIKTMVVHDRDRDYLYQMIRETLTRGEQAYVIYPLIEESEKLDLKAATEMSEELRRHFPEFELGLLHGKVDSEEKDRIMKSFKEGKVHLLVSTTVIEVGIDVPNATLMVIEQSERFGLSQLHQLRGRVGRGSKSSRCILVTPLPKNLPGFARLEIMCRYQDGFRIAEEDLKIRGAGDFMGTRQSGLPELRLANLIRDYHILEFARKEAFEWIGHDPSLLKHPPLKETLLRRWGERLALAEIA